MTSSFPINELHAWIEVRSRRRYYPWLLSLVLVCCSLFLAFPCFTCFDPLSEAWEVVMLKATEPAHGLDHISPYNWLSKKVFRLTVPLIIGATQLQPLGVIILQYLIGYLMIVHMYKLALRIMRDEVSSTYLTAGIVFLYFGRAAFHDLEHLWFDGFAFFFLIMALYAQRPWAIFLYSTAAAWTDERAFMALGIVFLFHQFHNGDRNNSFTIDRLRPNGKGGTVLISIAAYLAVRWLLSQRSGMNISTAGAEILYMRWTLSFLPIGTWTFLEGLWLLYALTIVLALKKRQDFLWSTLLAAMIAAIIISGCVSDITRSGSFLVPIVFILVHYLYEALSQKELRNMLLASFAVTLLFPAMMVCFHWEMEKWFQWPLFVEAARHLLDFLMVRLG